MTIFRTAARAAALLATATIVVSPVAAATRTIPITVRLSARPQPAEAWNAANEIYNDHRWRRYRHHRDGIDGGDLLGVLLIGGAIAAVAGAIDKDKQERRGDRTDGRDYPGADRPYDYRDNDRGPGADRDYGRAEGGDRNETGRAVDACSAEAARSGQVDEIFDVDKIDGEWRVKGDYRDGREFTCSVDANGRAYVGVDDQARNEPRDITGSDDADDRYATAQSPDFADPRGR